MPKPTLRSPRTLLVVISALASALAAACGSEGDGSEFDEGMSFSGSSGDGSSGSLGNGGSSGGAGDGGAGQEGCGPNLTGLVRDFRAYENGKGHPDFEHWMGNGQKGMVLPALGADRKPQWNPDPAPYSPRKDDIVTGRKQAFTESKATFDQWYRTSNVNQEFQLRLTMTPGPNGVSTYSNDHFFPIDGKGYGDQGLKDLQGRLHNFGFTFELHTEFKYNGGEVFTFTGDDDLWTFINGKLAIDLGGLHSKQTASVSLDAIAAEFKLEKGKTYPLDVFHAERHSEASNFRIDTSIEFTNCQPIIIN